MEGLKTSPRQKCNVTFSGVGLQKCKLHFWGRKNIFRPQKCKLHLGRSPPSKGVGIIYIIFEILCDMKSNERGIPESQ